MTYHLSSLSLVAVVGLLLGLSATPAAADTIVNINQGKGATVESCKKGPPVTWVNQDGTTGTDKHKNFKCTNGVMSQNIPTIDAENVGLAFGMNSSGDGSTVTFDEALRQCRAERSDDLLTCIDKRTGQRRPGADTMNKLGKPNKSKCAQSAAATSAAAGAAAPGASVCALQAATKSANG